jgi:hypothetical protein
LPELALKSAGGAGQPGFFIQFPVPIQDRHIRIFVAEISTDEQHAIGIHGRFLHAPVSALLFRIIFPRMEPVVEGPAFSSQSRCSRRLTGSARQRLIWKRKQENDTVVLPKQSAALQQHPAAELYRQAAGWSGRRTTDRRATLG